MKQFGKIIGSIVLAASMAPAAFAATTWNFQSSATTENLGFGSATGLGGVLPATTTACGGVEIAACQFGTGANQVTMSAVGTSDQLSGTLISSIKIHYYGDGAGWGAGPDTGAPLHAIDNGGKYEMVLLQFASAVSLNSVKIGWNGTDNQAGYGSDMSVLAFTGAASPSPFPGAGDTFSSLTGAWNAAATTGGWKAIGNYASVGTSANNTANVRTVDQAGRDSQTQQTTGIFSSYWLIGAYNPLAISTGTGASGLNPVDTFKLIAVAGCVAGDTTSTGCTPTNRVPEPGSLALFGLAMAGIVGLRRKSKARA